MAPSRPGRGRLAAAAILVVGAALLGGALRPLALLGTGVALFRGVRGIEARQEEMHPGTGSLRWIEAGEGPPLVLLHGLRGESSVWLRVVRPLARRGRRVLAPDLPGYGGSPPAATPATLEAAVHRLGDWLERIGAAPAALVGNSMGGWLALRLTLERPELVSAVVLVDSAGPLFDPPPGHLLVARRRADARRSLPLLFHRPPLAPGLVARGLALRDPRVSLDLLADMSSGRYRVEDLLGGVPRPVLVVWGASDRLIPLSVGRTLAAALPGGRLVVLEDAGHMPQLETPGPLVERIDGFLREAEAR